MKILKVYADTSVFGGVFDEEFFQESRKFFEEIKAGKFILVISDTVVDELSKAPDRVKNVLAELPQESVVFAQFSEKIEALRDAYVKSGVVDKASVFDAEHIAVASVYEVDFVVSWNFKHIVHYDKIAGYQAVNLLNGYKPISIYSPREVVDL